MGCAMKVERQARAVAEQPGAAVRGDQQFVGALRFLNHGADFEDGAQPLRPGQQCPHLDGGCRRFMDLVVVQRFGEG